MEEFDSSVEFVPGVVRLYYVFLFSNGLSIYSPCQCDSLSKNFLFLNSVSKELIREFLINLILCTCKRTCSEKSRQS